MRLASLRKSQNGFAMQPESILRSISVQPNKARKRSTNTFHFGTNLAVAKNARPTPPLGRLLRGQKAVAECGDAMNPKPTLVAEVVAEFLGTFVLMLFGIGVVAMVVLFPSGNAGETIHGGFTNITLGWGLAVMMGIYVAGKISGAHLNPAVTLAFAAFRDFPWRKVLPYCIAQTAGAFAAAALVYWNYLPAFRHVVPQLEHTAGVFTTFPAFPALPQAGFLDQLIGTGLLVLLIFAITDEFNMPPGSNLAPLMIGLVVVAIGMSFGGMH